MDTRVRHVVLVGRDLDAEAGLLGRVLGIEEAFREPPGLGLDMRNIVMPVGEDFLEVCVGAHGNAPARRYVQAAGPGGYMVLLQVADFEAARDRARAQGVRLVWEYECDGHRECHLHPADVGGAIVGIEWSRVRADWRWAGTDWRSHVRTDSVTGLAAVTLSSSDPAALAARWAAILGLAPVAMPDGSRQASLGGQLIRFAHWPQARSRLTGIDLLAADAAGVRRRAAAAGCQVLDGRVLAGGVSFGLVETSHP